MKKITNIFVVFIFVNTLIFFLSTLSYGKVVSNKIILGAAISLSGKYALTGTHTKNGYDFAIKTINDLGGIRVGGKTYQLEIQYYDDESNSSKANALLGRLVQHEGIDFLLGTSNLNSSIAAAEEVKRFSVPMIDANTFSKSLFNKNNNNVFRISGPEDENMNLVIDLISNKNTNSSVAIIFEQDLFFQDVKSSITEKIKDYNFNIVFEGDLPNDVKDIKETLKKIQVVIPDLLIISANSDYSMKVLEEIVELKIHIPMIAIQNCNSDISMKEKNLSDIQEYIICPAQWHKTLAYQDDIFGSTNDYAKQFENNYNYDPPSHVAQSSAAVLLYKDVVERADSFDANKIKDALTKTDLMTFFGPIKFNENGHNIYKQFLLIQIQEGKNMIVAPEKFADTELIFPMPKMPD